MNKTVYPFGGEADHSDPRQKDKKITGGKGANLAVMAEIGLPVPPGFTIATSECLTYLAGGSDFPPALRDQVAEALRHVERTVGKVLGDADDPLLVSVRSGAARLDARHDGHRAQPRPQRRDRRGPGRAVAATRASPGTATAASSRCIPMSCSGSITSLRGSLEVAKETPASTRTPS